jgi:hypothetical protein
VTPLCCTGYDEKRTRPNPGILREVTEKCHEFHSQEISAPCRGLNLALYDYEPQYYPVNLSD